MLDNMSINEIKKASEIINKKSEIEVSGNVNLKTIKKLSKLKIDFVSIGELTHSIKAFDFSIKEG